MTTEQFAYWLKGFFEIENPQGPLDERKVKIIKDHLDLVFHKITPDRDIPHIDIIDELKKAQEEFNEKHNKDFIPHIDINAPLCAGSDGITMGDHNYRVYC